eukprot:scaffold1169_cov120-Cylindrotheca_fusiformis.AAC.29
MIEIGRSQKTSQLKEDAIRYLEEMLANKMEEVAMLQTELARLSKHHVRDKHIVDPYGDTGKYTGRLHNHKPHGIGTMRYDDNRIYVGNWLEGRWHGFGRATFTNGDNYEGEYRHDQRHGQGTYRWHDDRVYTGGFVADRREGKGRYEWPDGAVYDGNFVKGQHDGQGTYKMVVSILDLGSKGFIMGMGEFYAVADALLCHHHKLFIFLNLTSFVLSSANVNGQAHGKGKEVNPDGTLRHDGQWEYDRPIRKKKL